RSGRAGKGPLVAAAGVAALVLLVLAGLLVHDLRGTRADADGSGGADTSGGAAGKSSAGSDGTASTPATEPSSAPAGGSDPDALPASWLGTWVGEGPGTPEGSLLTPRTDSFTVTLTLRAGRQGEIVGQQVSDVHDVDTGGNDGCTESLELYRTAGDTMVFAARSPHPTDPANENRCPTGRSYTVTMDGGVLRMAPASRAPGAPGTFTRQ
ncbi:hypothetical protein GA0115240_17521, partial [Streptomyces sp. DvalAA-14]